MQERRSRRATSVYVLIALVEKSLIMVNEDGDRYRLLETIRAYAMERLAESDDAEAVRQRHRDYFLALAEEAEPQTDRYGAGHVAAAP